MQQDEQHKHPITPPNARGELGRRVIGKVLAEISTNGEVLRITCSDGTDVGVVWVDDGGNILKGKPLLVQHGIRLKVKDPHAIVTAHAVGLPGLKPTR